MEQVRIGRNHFKIQTMRDKPCLCACCPEGGAVFFATAIHKKLLWDSASNRETLTNIQKYFTDGYDITVKNVGSFKLHYCEHLKNKP